MRTVSRDLHEKHHHVIMWRCLAASSKCARHRPGQRGARLLSNAAVASTKAPSRLLLRNNATAPLPQTTATCRAFSSRDGPVSYQCVHVFVSVKPGTEDDFLAASLANARASSRELGIARFDVIQQEDDPTKFVLVEVYKCVDAPKAHKATEHYLAWRESVEHMMAEPRRAIRYRNLFPATAGGWDYGDGISLE